MAPTPPTNTVILTESASNIRRLLDDPRGDRRRDLQGRARRHQGRVRRRRDARRAGLGDLRRRGPAATGAGLRRARGPRAARGLPAQPARGAGREPVTRPGADHHRRAHQLADRARRARSSSTEMRELVAKLDVPVSGGGRIHVYYLKHADAEELAQTLTALISGQAGAGRHGHGRRARRRAPDSARRHAPRRRRRRPGAAHRRSPGSPRAITRHGRPAPPTRW